MRKLFTPRSRSDGLGQNGPTSWTDVSLIGAVIACLAILVPLTTSQAQLNEQKRATELGIRSAEQQTLASKREAADAATQSAEAQKQADAARADAAALRMKLEGIQKQMEQEGAVIRVSGWLEIQNPGEDRPTKLASDSAVSIETADRSQLYLVILVTNEGRYKATVSAVGLSSGLRSTWTGFYDCPDAKVGYSRCAQRVVVEPQQQRFVSFRIDRDIFRDTICGDARTDHLAFMVGLLGAPIADGTIDNPYVCA